jgi:tetratricopeptide (TPR) repeat protein
MGKGVVASLLALTSVVRVSAQPSRWAEAMKKGRELQAAYHFQEAENQFQEALAAAEKLPNSARMQATALYDLATAAEDLGNTDKEAKLCSRAIAILSRNFGEDDPDLQRVRIELAAVYIPSGQFNTSENLLRQTLAGQSRAGQNHSLEAGLAWYTLANLYTHQHKFAKAEDAIRRALTILDERKAPPELLATVRGLFGLILNWRGRHAEALAQTEQAAEIARINEQVQPSVRMATLATLASLYAAEGRTEAADEANQEALSLTMRIYGPKHFYSGWLWLARAAILRKAHRKLEAKEAQHRGQEILASSGIGRLGNSVPYTALIPPIK